MEKEIVFADRLKELRLRRGLTQQQVVDQIGCIINTAQVYSNYESGKREPNYMVLCKLSKFFGVTTDYLLGLSDEELPQMKETTALTGLSTIAISNINILSSDEKARLNDLLEDWRLFGALRQLAFLYKIIDLGKETISVLDSSLSVIREELGTEGEPWNRAQKAVSNRVAEAKAQERYARFEVIDAFTKLIDHLYPLNNYDQINEVCFAEEWQQCIERMEQYARSMGENGLADFIAGKGEWAEK